MAPPSVNCYIEVVSGRGVLDLKGGGGLIPAVVNWQNGAKEKRNQQWLLEPVSGSSTIVTITNTIDNRRIIGNGHDRDVSCDKISVDDKSAQWYLEGGSLDDYRNRLVRFRNVKHDSTYLDHKEGKVDNGVPFCTFQGNNGDNQAFFIYQL